MPASDTIDQQRRRLFGAAAVTLAAAPFVANAQAEPVKQAGGVGTGNAFGSLKQIHAGPLDIGYAEAGPANGPVVILLHGWPYDIYSFVDVAPALAAAGFRVIVPYLLGSGP